jgi:hypothetical protein
MAYPFVSCALRKVPREPSALKGNCLAQTGRSVFVPSPFDPRFNYDNSLVYRLLKAFYLTSQSNFAILLTRITNGIVDDLFTTKKLGKSSTKREYIMRWYEFPGIHISVDEGDPGFSLDRGRKCITRTSTCSAVVRTTMRDEIFLQVPHPLLGDDSGLMKRIILLQTFI